MKEISNKILKTELVTWKDLKFLQSENLKDLSKQAEEKLKQSILNNDFCQTFNVWQKGKDIFLLDGHHRVKILKKLEEEGCSIPEKFPANFIDCKNRKEACKLLLIYSSIYAKIEQDGLVEFLELEELTFDDLKFDIELPDMDFEDIFKETKKSEQHSNSYNDDAMPEIEEFKQLYRIEAMNFVNHVKLIEVFAGRSALTYWYKRVFGKVITNDKQTFDGINHDYNLTAEKFIKTELKNHLDFNYIDFDDEGCPGKEIQLFFEVIKSKKDKFILAITDGQGLNFKSRGKINLFETYIQGDNKTIQATEEMYKSFPEIFREFINQLSIKYNFNYREISLHRKQNGNCIYATYLIEKC